MITPSFSLTATERVLPKLALDFTTASLDPRVTFTRTTDATHPATYVNSSGYITAATNNQARFDYNPATLTCKGLLIEESRSNLVYPSNDFSGWPAAALTIGTAAVTSPDGSATVSKFQEDNTNAVHFLLKQFSGLTSGDVYTISIYAKQAERSWIKLEDSASVSASAYFNLATGTIGTVSGTGSPSATITDAGNGYYRCTLTFAVGASGQPRCRFDLALADNGGAYQGVTGYGIYAYGAQFEKGAFATSYIPTTSAALTRNADVATMTGTNFTSWYNATEGSCEVQYQTSVAGGGGYILCFSKDAINYIEIGGNIVSGGNKARYINTLAGTTNVNAYTSNTISLTNSNKLAFCYKQDNFAMSLNAGAMLTDTSGSIATFTGFEIGSYLEGASRGGYINGWVQKINYWPQRLLNAELQAFSK